MGLASRALPGGFARRWRGTLPSPGGLIRRSTSRVPSGRGEPETGASSPLDGDGALDPLPTPQARQDTRSREPGGMCWSPTTQSRGEGAQPGPQGTPNGSSSETQAPAAALPPGHQLPPPPPGAYPSKDTRSRGRSFGFCLSPNPRGLRGPARAHSTFKVQGPNTAGPEEFQNAPCRLLPWGECARSTSSAWGFTGG